MTDRAVSDISASSRIARASPTVALVRQYGLPLSVLALAIILRAFAGTCANVSWLLTIGDKVLAGATPYVDVVEVNPPISILMYLPAVLIGRALGIPPETVVTSLVILATLASLALVSRILAAAGSSAAASAPLSLALALFVLLIFPAYAFGERDHIAAIAVLPMLAACAARVRGARVDLVSAVLAGLGGGIAIAIKPFFVFALALPLAYAAARSRRGLRGFVSGLFTVEAVTAGGVALAYAASIIIFFPAFLRVMLPLATEIYLPNRLPLTELLRNPSSCLFAIILVIALVLDRKRPVAPMTRVLKLAACGFMIAFLIQDKGSPYQGYPAVALALLACGRSIADGIAGWSRGERRAAAVIRPALAAGVLVIVAGIAMMWLQVNHETAGLVEAARRVAPPNPKVIVIGDRLGLGHPLTRELGGRWVGRQCSLWITDYAETLLQDEPPDAGRRSRIESYVKFDYDMLREDIIANRPDLILVENDRWRGWIVRHDELARLLQSYREADRFEGVSILLRKADGPA
ncbi:MAG: hypothetical protein JOZ40_18835 [Methylobacteriaceae bacterium]|nr:hypothetical protein [Methylobacteriaceae bacterium]